VNVENPSIPPTPPTGGNRDRAIDILRGLALITITVNHISGFTYRMGMEGVQFPTLTLWGFSSAAETFFLLSGYLVGAVYFNAASDPSIPDFARKVWARVRKLYIYNLALFIGLLPFCWFSADMARLSFYHYFFRGGTATYLQFLLLYVQPYCLEILVTYMVLLALAPFFAILLRAQALIAITASAALYWYAHEHPFFNVPGGAPLGDWQWNFNPASWQVLFFGAMAAGRYRLLDGLQRITSKDRRWIIPAWAAFAALTWLFMAQEAVDALSLYQSKIRLGPLRAIHAVSVSWAIMSLFWAWPRLQNRWIARQCAMIGANSLQNFVACVAISYVAGFLWIEYMRSHTAYMLLCTLAVIVLGLFANIYQGWKTRDAMARKDFGPAEAPSPS
jgi:hypothetical protein